MMKWFLSACAILCLRHIVIGQSDWKLQKDEAGIAIYTRDLMGYDVDEVKAVTKVKSTLSSIIAVIQDVDQYKNWVFACEESKILERISSAEQYHYIMNDLPYPFEDRDEVVHLTIVQDLQTGIVSTASVGKPAYMNEIKNRVRMPAYFSGYKLTALPDGFVEISFQLRLDPGGYLPGWLVNMFIVKGPFESIIRLRTLAVSEKYSSLVLPFIKEMN